jgi:hypothetical protein
MKKEAKRKLEILSEPHQLIISILVIGGMISFFGYGLVVNIILK